MSNWMSENAVAAEAGRAGASTSCSKSVAWESRKAVMAPVLSADRRLSAVLASVSASMADSFQRVREAGSVPRGPARERAGPGPGSAEGGLREPCRPRPAGGEVLLCGEGRLAGGAAGAGGGVDLGRGVAAEGGDHRG